MIAHAMFGDFSKGVCLSFPCVVVGSLADAKVWGNQSRYARDDVFKAVVFCAWRIYLQLLVRSKDQWERDR